ncbi:uncharacterized protein LOC110855745 [Folsomia candida]|uniref:uncharacterized protein LOC110855745 n=1 Tax=Folsomia candida TaxID=158441 RepID=UPI000B908ACA|nr:uncharacterized protein LOC110855745 [Folsomia candida]
MDYFKYLGICVLAGILLSLVNGDYGQFKCVGGKFQLGNATEDPNMIWEKVDACWGNLTKAENTKCARFCWYHGVGVIDKNFHLDKTVWKEFTDRWYDVGIKDKVVKSGCMEKAPTGKFESVGKACAGWDGVYECWDSFFNKLCIE